MHSKVVIVSGVQCTDLLFDWTVIHCCILQVLVMGSGDHIEGYYYHYHYLFISITAAIAAMIEFMMYSFRTAS